MKTPSPLHLEQYVFTCNTGAELTGRSQACIQDLTEKQLELYERSICLHSSSLLELRNTPRIREINTYGPHFFMSRKGK